MREKHLGLLMMSMLIGGLSGCATYQPQYNNDIEEMIERDVGDVDQEFVDRVMTEPTKADRKARARARKKAKAQALTYSQALAEICRPAPRGRIPRPRKHKRKQAHSPSVESSLPICTKEHIQQAKLRVHEDEQERLHRAVEEQIQRKIAWWIRYYTIRERELFQRALDRGENYRPLVQQILREHHLPSELYYLAMIESGYVTKATSHVSAVGIWQFMRPTALHYGLGVDGAYDERHHPIAATHAAARYLTFLHKKFGCWYLAIAAYNAGQGRISTAIKRAKTNDFWLLAYRKKIPQETMDYIPKFLAAATIGEHKEKFAFQTVQPKQPWPEIAFIDLKLNKKMKVKDIAKKASLSENELIRFNPLLKIALSRSRLKRVRVWIPRDSLDRFVITDRQNSAIASRNSKKRSTNL